ncbi:hypothetical protein JCM21900_006296 [Sporobolomyces salmonicolor]
MEQELAAASSFLASYLPSHASTFPSRLEAKLAIRYATHWHPSDPERGSAYRALVRVSSALDSSIVAAAAEAGLKKADLEVALLGKEQSVTLGARWTLWVDPGCVSLRIDRGDGGAARDGQFIEIWGKLPESLRSHAIPLAAAVGTDRVAGSSNIAAVAAPSPPIEAGSLPFSASSPPDHGFASPVKKVSKAIQILPPPGGRVALQAMTNAALRPDSPGRSSSNGHPALLASPLIIPPTPVRPLPAAEADVFSPTPAASSSSSLLVPRSPSPRSYGALSPTSSGPSSPLGMPIFVRRSSSRASSISSRSHESDGETSGTDSVFSAASSLDSLTTTSSMWKGLDSNSRDLVDADGFRVPALPLARPASTGPFAFPGHARSHSRGSSISSLAPPPSPSRSLPSSPTKPRRRGVRGGQGRSESRHEHSASISSLSSITSSTSSTIAAPRSPSTPAPPTPSRSRTSTSTSIASSAATATEYSNGLVKVLGGGVLLGCAKSRSTTEGDSNRRRGRERRRGGRGTGSQNPSPMGSFSYPSPGGIMQATSPVWMPHAPLQAQ